MRKTDVRAEGGFTLIELLVVISIIALLSSVVLASVNSARRKAIDVKIVAQMQALQKGVELYRLNTNSYPSEGLGAWVDDYCGGTGFQDELQVLVSNRVMSSIPTHPANNSCDEGYDYYIYWSNYVDAGSNNFQDNDAQCGGKPIRNYMIMNYSNKPILKGLKNLNYGGSEYLEYQCIGD